MKNAINHFEISVGDFDRAKKFYEAIFNYQMNVLNLGEGFKMGFLPSDEGGVTGTIIWNESFYRPSENGVLVYLNGNPDLSEILDRVEAAGGKIIIAKREISPEFGYMAIFNDSEGNRIALQSDK